MYRYLRYSFLNILFFSFSVYLQILYIIIFSQPTPMNTSKFKLVMILRIYNYLPIKYFRFFVQHSFVPENDQKVYGVHCHNFWCIEFIGAFEVL
jgi:hypothetical protein